jgi:hypothetical protein
VRASGDHLKALAEGEAFLSTEGALIEDLAIGLAHLNPAGFAGLEQEGVRAG